MSAHDLSELAGQARRTLAMPAQATLLVSGIGPVAMSDPSILLHDRDGRPNFICEPGSPVITAAGERREAVLTLRADTDTQIESVGFVGSLTNLGVEQVDGVPVRIIALAPARVYVQVEDPALHALAQLEVPLSLYLRADDGLLSRQFQRIQHHTNHAHQDELRRFAALRSGVPIGQIAGAALARLDGYGADVQWVDADGAHVATLEFATRATCPRTVAAMLRGHLTGS